MTPKEIIEICQAIERGEKVECEQSYGEPGWYSFINGRHSLDFDSKRWRIAKPEPKKVKLYGFIEKNTGMHRSIYSQEPQPDWWRAPQFDTEVEE